MGLSVKNCEFTYKGKTHNKYNEELGAWKADLQKIEKSIKSNNASRKQEEASLSALNYEMQGAEKISKSLGLDFTCTPAQPPHHMDKLHLSSTMIDTPRFPSQMELSGGKKVLNYSEDFN